MIYNVLTSFALTFRTLSPISCVMLGDVGEPPTGEPVGGFFVSFVRGTTLCMRGERAGWY